MDGPHRAIPQFTSRQVLSRFVLRLALLATFANFGNQGFVITFSTLLALAAIFCSIVGTLRRGRFARATTLPPTVARPAPAPPATPTGGAAAKAPLRDWIGVLAMVTGHPAGPGRVSASTTLPA